MNDDAYDYTVSLQVEIDRLQELNAEMLAALGTIETWLIAPDFDATDEMREIVCAAIAKATKV